MSAREDVEAAVQSLEDAQSTDANQVLPEQHVPVPEADGGEPAPAQETAEEKEVRLGRTAGRPRDEKGRLLPGKPVKEAAPEPVKAVAPEPVAAAPAKPALPRPASWKKEHWDSWNKIAAENPQLAQYLNQREQEFTSGVSTYKQEFERVAPLAQAIQPFEQMLQQEGIAPAQWIGSVANAHRILKYGSDQERLQAGLKLIADYRIPVLEYLQQGGQLQAMPQAQQFRQPMPQAQQDPRALVREEIMAMQTATELQQFQSATDADGQPLYPHYEEVKLDMAQLLEAGRAQDLKTAYTKAIRMNDELWQAEQERLTQAKAQAQLQEKAKAVAKAKANTVSVRSATPTAPGNGAKPTGTREAVNAAYDVVSGQGGRV